MLYLNDPDACAEIIRNEILKAHQLESDDRYLTVAQVKNLILEKCERDGEELLATDDVLKSITDQSQSILLGSFMSGMAARGELECAWDDKSNDMVWWLPEKKK